MKKISFLDRIMVKISTFLLFSIYVTAIIPVRVIFKIVDKNFYKSSRRHADEV